MKSILTLAFIACVYLLNAQTVTNYDCDFESYCDTLRPRLTGAWEIGQPNTVPFFGKTHSGLGTLVTGKDNTPQRNSNGYYQIEIPNYYHSIQITFKHRSDFGQGKSGGYLTFSFDSGATWVNAANLNTAYPGEGFYTQGLYDSSNTINGTPCFSGSELDWKETQIVLMNYVPSLRRKQVAEKDNYTWGNERLLMRFNYFIGPEITNAAGWCIDDLNIEAMSGGGITEPGVTPLVRVWPIPFSSVLNLKTEQTVGINKITISDISGKPMLTEEKCFTNINTSELPAGIYFITASTEKGPVINRIIKY